MRRWWFFFSTVFGFFFAVLKDQVQFVYVMFLCMAHESEVDVEYLVWG